MHILLVVALLAALALPAQARPVSYPGGVMPMLMNNGDSHALELDYSPTAFYSIGYRGEYWREKDWKFHGLQGNYLLKRWNLPKSQANLYLKGAAGAAWNEAGHSQAAGLVGFAADWEDRRYFTSYENEIVEAGDIDGFFMQKARLGIAPYIGDYGDLHTWLMVELRHSPEAAAPVTVTPLVRLFKGATLGEAGISNRGDVLFNLTLQF